MKPSEFLIDVLKMMPENSQIEIWSNEEMLKVYLKPLSAIGWSPIKFDLKSRDFELLVESGVLEEIPDCVESIKIWSHGKKKFEGWDGLEVGTISKSIMLPIDFVEKYIDPGDCFISKEW